MKRLRRLSNVGFRLGVLAIIMIALSPGPIVKSKPLRREPVQTTAVSPMDVVQEMIGRVNLDRALTDLRRISGEEPICSNANGCQTITHRKTGSNGLHWAKDYIYEELVSLGYSVEVNNWWHLLPPYADQNIIARKPGRFLPNEEIFIVAHMDGVEAGGAADDDGSGVADLLELARVLHSYTFNRTIVLFFSTGEEQGSLGVESYLDELSPAKISSIKYVVDIDMIGYDANQDTAMELWYGDGASSLALTQVMSETIATYQLNLAPTYVTGCG